MRPRLSSPMALQMMRDRVLEERTSQPRPIKSCAYTWRYKRSVPVYPCQGVGFSMLWYNSPMRSSSISLHRLSIWAAIHATISSVKYSVVDNTIRQLKYLLSWRGLTYEVEASEKGLTRALPCQELTHLNMREWHLLLQSHRYFTFSLRRSHRYFPSQHSKHILEKSNSKCELMSFWTTVLR